MPSQTPARVGDAAAISLSGLCLAHCLALPVLAASLLVLGFWAEAEWVHWIFVALAIPMSICTLSRPHRLGPPVGALFLAMAGCGLLIAGAVGYPTHDLETPLTVAGGLTLATAHLLNWRRQAHRH